MQLIKKEILDFASATSFIHAGMKSPILKNFIIKGSSIIKSGGDVTAVGKITNDDQELYLLQQDALLAFLGATPDKIITVTNNESGIILSDSLGPAKLAKEDPNELPTFPDMNEFDRHDLSTEDKAAIAISLQFTGDSNSGNHSCVHIKDGLIFGYTQAYTYINNTKHAIPLTILSKKEAIICADSDYIGTSDRFHFFEVDGVRFVFTKSEEKTVDISRVINATNGISCNEFEINKDDLISFCELANRFIIDQDLACILENGEAKTVVGKERDLTRKIQVSGSPFIWPFNSRIILKPMSALQIETLHCSEIQHTLVIKNESETICFAGYKK